MFARYEWRQMAQCPLIQPQTLRTNTYRPEHDLCGTKIMPEISRNNTSIPSDLLSPSNFFGISSPTIDKVVIAIVKS